MPKRYFLAAGLTMIVTPTLAHTGTHMFAGLAAGFMHPFGGFDHIVAMMTVGLYAAWRGGQALWAVPASFLVMMLAGGALGIADAEFAGVEGGITASVVALGAIIAWGRSLSMGMAMALVGGFAVFHGYAHGAEIPDPANPALFSLGFVSASALLHGVGIAAGSAISSRSQSRRLAGAAVAVTGLILAFG